MTLSTLIVIALTLLIVAAFTATRSAVAASAERLARRVNLRLDDAVRPQVELFERRRQLGSGVGAAFGAATALLLVPEDSGIVAFLVMIGLFGGVTVGVALAALGHLRGARSATSTVASAGRLSPVDVDDLVPRGERYGLRYTAVGAAAVTLTALAVLLPARGLVPEAEPTVIASLALLAIGIAAVIGWELVARRIARTRPVSGDVQALAWSDALRSLTLRDMVAFPLATCLYGPLTLLLATNIGALDSMTRLLDGVALSGIVVVAAIIAATLAIMQANPTSGRSPAQHYQRRLWPAIAVRRPGAEPVSASSVGVAGSTGGASGASR
ncbi:hypothetical protein OVN20_03310 [Microcella daejeonensis]|uniref:hypothetical protein n=1 Tax=Microcella daejeonensis TaxID=2994971 RepID=UPI00226FE44A|nr:hypothetical protein [Microcella daejeonensis]WAB84609.1 hypothetical protein OVN20_03310 [Microcella daejeonensis]